MFNCYKTCLVSLFVASVSSYNILGLFPLPMKSHYLVFDALMIELSRRGHNVTNYNTFVKNYSMSNYHEVDITHCFDAPDMSNLLTCSKGPPKPGHFMLKVHQSYDQITKCIPLMNLLNTTVKYDVIITEIFNTEFFVLFGVELGISVIAFHANSLSNIHGRMIGLSSNPSYIPNLWSGYISNSKMNFLQRLRNMMLNFYGIFWYNLVRREYNEIAERIFGSDVPQLENLAGNISFMFSYAHFAINSVRPLVPNVAEVGGLNIRSSQPLPQNIEKFINESKHGVVYFCMGSLLRGETFPPEKREAFLYAFSKIPQRVLWKWEGDVLPGKSDNIMISKWMPQRDILAHPNVKLFISHGGLLGTSEAVYEGVPVLGIPIFGDQRTNIKSLEANGAGELLDYNEISKEVVLEKIQRLLNDPKYKENAKLLSDRYRDRPMSPLDTAVYWTEYVIRHKGAPHLRTAAADMPWYQYLLLDVIAFIVAVLVAGLLIIYYTTKFILRAIYGLICGGGAKKGSSKSDKKKRN
ncbi:UDP-glycosyltransferase UGT5-like isoform X2 [Planococcus citri]|uniref:UDP-glycosyltransferase UGT5-like isoform X2 n=1 Tax=Planococcus citri TaxID=170843 RepID=UPI0031F9719C